MVGGQLAEAVVVLLRRQLLFRRRREDHDLLDEGAAVDRVRPHDAREGFAEIFLRKLVLRYGCQCRFRVQLAGQFRLGFQQVSRWNQGEELRWLVPAGRRDEFLDLPGERWKISGRLGARHGAIVAPGRPETGTGTTSVELDI
ncbi:hypothetical protein GCM10029964_010970 [Kibdelosporangium lantanae]